MTVALLDRCSFTPTAGGTADFAVSAAVTGFQTPTAAGAVNGVEYSFFAQSSDLTQWEYGYYTWNSSTTTMARSTILGSSNSGSKVNFTVTPTVTADALAENLVTSLNALAGAITLSATGGDVVSSGGTAITFGSPGGYRNLLRNGTLDIWQRGSASITVATAGAYTADGWIVTPTGASCTAQCTSNSRGGSNTLYQLELTGASSVTDIQLSQRIESYIAARLAGKTVTVQAWVYNGTGSSITPTLTTKYAGSTDVWTSPATDLSATNLQACANVAWTQIAYTLSVSTSATAGYEFIFDFGNNFSTTGKYVTVAEVDVRVTPGVSTGLNSNPPPPELRPISVELPFCQRYLSTNYDAWQTPGSSQTSAAGSIAMILNGGSVDNGAPMNINFAGTVRFPVPMFAAPSILYWDRAGNASMYSQFIAVSSNGTPSWTDNISAFAGITAGKNGFFAYNTDGNIIPAFFWLASAEL